MSNKTVAMCVQKGERVELKCCCHGTKRIWIGPSKNKTAHLINPIYFSNNQRNPKINLSKYVVQEHEGGYDLIISNFQHENTGTYICRYEISKLYHETKYDVSLVSKYIMIKHNNDVSMKDGKSHVYSHNYTY